MAILFVVENMTFGFAFGTNLLLKLKRIIIITRSKFAFSITFTSVIYIIAT
jgi:hypothetical protein